MLAWSYLAFAIVALPLPLINSRGWLGMAPDPLSAIFAVLLARPWISFFGHGLAAPPVLGRLRVVAGRIGLSAICCSDSRRLFHN
jgi:hypothetical protein